MQYFSVFMILSVVKCSAVLPVLFLLFSFMIYVFFSSVNVKSSTASGRWQHHPQRDKSVSKIIIFIIDVVSL